MNPLDMLDKMLSNPHMVHAATVQFPVALAILGMPLVLLGGIVKMQWTQYRWVMVIWYLLLAGSGFLSILTGEQVLSALPAALGPNVRDVMDLHESMAQILWILAIATAILILLCGIKTDWFRATCAVLAILMSIATGGWAAFIGYQGISLVYEHGLGTSAKPAVVAPAEPSAPAVPTIPKPLSPQDTIAQPANPAVPTPNANIQPNSATQLLTSDPSMLRKDINNRESYTTRLANFFRDVKKYVWP